MPSLTSLHQKNRRIERAENEKKSDMQLTNTRRPERAVLYSGGQSAPASLCSWILSKSLRSTCSFACTRRVAQHRYAVQIFIVCCGWNTGPIPRLRTAKRRKRAPCHTVRAARALILPLRSHPTVTKHTHTHISHTSLSSIHPPASRCLLSLHDLVLTIITIHHLQRR